MSTPDNTSPASSEHSPAPWTYGEINCDGSGFSDLIDCKKKWIASVNSHHDNHSGFPTEAECRANCRLIASAPEMLSFLKFLVYDGNLPSTCENSKDTENCLKCMAMDLIAKAEGKDY